MSAYKQQKRDKKKAVLANHKQRLEQEAHTQVLAWYESTGRDREARLEPSELRDLFAHVCPQAQITDMLQSLLFDAYTRRVDGTVAGAPAAPAGAGDSKLVLLPVDHVVLRYHACTLDARFEAHPTRSPLWLCESQTLSRGSESHR